MRPGPARPSGGLLDWLLSAGVVGSAVFIGYKNLIEHVYPVFYQLPAALSSALAALLAVSFLCLVRIAQTGRARRVQGRLPLFWLGGAAAACAVCLGMVWGVDPHGHFGSPWFQPMVLSARGEKLRAYADLPRRPQLVVLGSSNTFTISPADLQERLGLSTFNFGVEAAQIEDALLAARLIYRLSTGSTPAVFLIEVNEPLLNGELTAAKRASVAEWRAMEPAMFYLTLQYQARETFHSQSLADAAFVLLYYVQNKVPPLDWEFRADGEGVYSPPYSVTDGIITNSVQNDIKENLPATCSTLDPLGQNKVQQLITLAEGHGTALVFFRGPVHRDYYRAALEGNAEFEECHARLVEYLQGLVEQNASVYFMDLLQPASLADMGNQAFYDSHHLSPAGADVLVEILAPVLREAAGQYPGSP